MPQQQLNDDQLVEIQHSKNPALFRVLRQLDSSTYELYNYGGRIEVAYFIHEQMGYAVLGDNLGLIEEASSAMNVLEQWLGQDQTAQ
ncbi:MAG: hypothetical protein AAFR24_06705 [Cyanobacteria bacterium J06627_3]